MPSAKFEKFVAIPSLRNSMKSPYGDENMDSERPLLCLRRVELESMDAALQVA